MTTTTITLTDFLLARIAEDEVRARRATGISPVAEVMTGARPASRWLAECGAKRRIVGLHWQQGWHVELPNPINWDDQPPPGQIPCRRCTIGEAEPCDTLRALAAVYADHPDYREEWAL